MRHRYMVFTARFLTAALLLHCVSRSANAATLVAVGDQGTILRSTDSGLHWTPVSSGTSQGIHSVTFVNSTVGWAVGENATMLHTNDGGQTWSQSAPINGVGWMWSVDFVDANHGWVGTNVPVGDGGIVLRTVDGGQTWQSSGKVWTWAINGVDFADTQNGWAVGANGGIVHTTDGGASWTVQSASGPSHTNVNAIDPNNAWVLSTFVSQQPIIHTTNGGSSWTAPSLPSIHTYSDITFAGTEGWAAGLEKSMLHTLNGGLTWTETVLGTQYDQTVGTNFYSVAFDPTAGCWASGYYGRIAFSADHGATWSVESTNTTHSLYDIAIVPIPEPSTFVLLGVGAISLLAYAWRRRRV
jgi:photosystem II stability/assembly factor-like uncharacterized protein